MTDEDNICWTMTPRAMVIKLLPSISDNSTIAAYTNSHFGTRITAARVAELRRDNPVPRQTQLGDAIGTGENRRWEQQARLSDARMVDRLSRYVGK